MKRTLLLTGLLLLPLAPVHGATGPAPSASADAPASDASLRELMDVTQTRKLVDNVYGQMDSSFDAGTKAGIGDRTLTESQQKIVDDSRRKMSALMHEELSWERLEPMFFDIYRQTFSQTEIDGMLAFYRSDTGQAVIAKMPRVMEATMKSTLSLVSDMAPKLRRIVTEMREALDADAGSRRRPRRRSLRR